MHICDVVVGFPKACGRHPPVLLIRYRYLLAHLPLENVSDGIIPHAELENVALEWAAEMNTKSPTAMRMLKFGFNLIDMKLLKHGKNILKNPVKH